jgi:hypothetical protein
MTRNSRYEGLAGKVNCPLCPVALWIAALTGSRSSVAAPAGWPAPLNGSPAGLTCLPGRAAEVPPLGRRFDREVRLADRFTAFAAP